MQQPGAGDEVAVVAVVERVGGQGVQRRQRGVAAGRRAGLPLVRRERRAHVGVAVDAGAEVDAAGAADGVRAGQRGEVARAQALGGEGGDESGDVGLGAREVGRHRAPTRRQRVAAAERHRPARPAELHTCAQQGLRHCVEHMARARARVCGVCVTDQVDGVARGEGEDVGAGDGGGADGLDLGLDGVDEVEDGRRADGVGADALLAGRRGGVVEEHRRVAAL